jgi:class 3 adenylate cyclase
VHVGSLTIGRGVLEPGFRWSTSLKPIQGTPSSQIHHLQLQVQGRFHVEMDNGETAEIGPGDVFDVPPGPDVWVVGDEPVVVVDVFGNIGALGVPGEHERLVTTLLMSDIVDSTLTAARLGDAAWKQLLAEHNRLIRTQFDRFRGWEVNTTGDGFLAMFGSAAGALRAAVAMRDGIRGLDIELRIGVHTGEVDVLPNDIGGVAVHAAARIMALGRASEIIVSSVTRGLVEGSGLRFEERGRRQVKGLERPIEVFLLAT